MIPDEELIEVIKAAFESVMESNPHNPRGAVSVDRIASRVAEAIQNNYKLVKRDEVEHVVDEQQS